MFRFLIGGDGAVGHMYLVSFQEHWTVTLLHQNCNGDYSSSSLLATGGVIYIVTDLKLMKHMVVHLLEYILDTVAGSCYYIFAK